MEKLVEIKDIKTGAIMKVKSSLASDYIGTGNFELVINKPIINDELVVDKIKTKIEEIKKNLEKQEEK